MGDEMMGFRLKQAREKAGLTQDAVCQKIGLANNQSLSAYERGTSSPSVETLKKLCATYGVSADFLLFGNDRLSSQDKTPLEYAKQLVDAVDHLGLKLDEGQFLDGIHSMLIWLNTSYADFNEFTMHWYRLRDILDAQTLASEEYKMLIGSRLAALKMIEPPPKHDLHWDDIQLPF